VSVRGHEVVSLGQMDLRYYDILVDVPAVGDRAFTYCCPAEISLPRGAKVRVPFARTKTDGYVLGESLEKLPRDIKAIEEVYDLAFLPPHELLDLIEALGRYHLATTAAAWSYLYPPVVPKKSLSRLLKEGWLSAQPHASTPVDDCGESARGLGGKIEDLPVLYVWGGADFRWHHYLRLAEESLRAGKAVLFLLPEIKVLEGALARLEERFPGEVSLLSSETTGLARRAAWLALLRGEAKIGAGTRSAAFAPVKDLGLVVLDEESSPSHKAVEWPFFDARTVALARGAMGARVVFGSAYPSVEAFLRIRSAKWLCVREESPGPGIPRTRIIDLKEYRAGRDIISEPLREELEAAFQSGFRAVLFLNRRGDSSQVSCRDCGSVILCPRCGVPMVYHSKEMEMACHTCGYREDAPVVCPKCSGHNWRFSGVGVERVESEFKRKFPGIPVLRLDQDVTRKTRPSEILEAFGRLSPGCLVCTQIVLGQSQMPRVGLVGVLSADTPLSIPDFRASERAYQLLSNLKDLLDPGLGDRSSFVVQTRNPDHHAIKGAVDGESFYETELQMRRMLGYPPFGKFIRVRFESRSFEKAKEAASEFASRLSKAEDVTVLGPAAAPKPKVRGVYRWHVALKGPDHESLATECGRALEALQRRSSVKVLVDIDPVQTE